MAQIDSIGTSYPDQNELLQGLSVGYGYKEKQGVINLNFSYYAETPPSMSEEEIESHIMGFVLIEIFIMKKGINILATYPRLQ